MGERLNKKINSVDLTFSGCICLDILFPIFRIFIQEKKNVEYTKRQIILIIKIKYL